MLKNFFLCGAIGWCLEILWTGWKALLMGDLTMTGRTSLLMFPIYGCAVLIRPAYRQIAELPMGLRGYLYTGAFFAVEFTSGILLTRLGICPWNYAGAALSVCGVIRLDYAPLWFLSGLFYEKILIS